MSHRPIFTDSRSVFLSIRSSRLLAVSTSALLGLGGCALPSGAPTLTPSAHLSLSGQVHGGQQPVSGSHVFLYAASAANAGPSASLLGAPGYAVTDVNGDFSITGSYTCPTGADVYLLALGGNPGLGGNANNPKLALMAGLGACSALNPSQYFSVNEVTTVAAAFSLAPYATSENRIGATPASALSSAFANITNLIDPADGTARATTPSGNGTVPQAKINSLANSLAPCINSDGTGSACISLFSAAKVSSGGSTPADTVQAVLNIADNPTVDVTAIYNLASPETPFQPSLSGAPSDWTIAIQYPPPFTVALSPASVTVMQSGQQEFVATASSGTAGSYQWTTSAAAGLLNEVGGTGKTAQTSYCSTSGTTTYLSKSTPALTATASDTVSVETFTGTGCVPANSVASKTANISVVHAYTSVVIFGDASSDTGNFANVTNADYGIRYPGPDFNYADGRFTDDTSSMPAATLYTGVWVEQLAATFPTKPGTTDSLDGGTNYAYADATTADGTTSVTTGGLSVTVENMGQQVTDYLATKPTITNNTLFVVWGGATELYDTSNDTVAGEDAAAAREVALIQRLITAGATDFLVPNVPPLGALPEYNTTANASAETQAASGFNQALSTDLEGLPAANPTKTLRIVPFDVFSLFTVTIGPPIGEGFVDVTNSAQGQTGVNPDEWLFWDDVHVTTGGQHLLANGASAVIVPQ